jgi:hypothetical protein
LSGKHVYVAPRGRHPVWAATGRFAFGLPVWGDWQTDADWLGAGTKSLGRRPPRELCGLRLGYRPGYQRMAFRWATTLGVSYEAVGWLTHPWSTGFNTSAGVAAVATGYGYRAWLRHKHDATAPLASVLQVQLRELLKVEYPDATVRTSGRVEVTLPERFVLSGASASTLHGLVERTVGHELDATWPDLTKSRTVSFERPPEPPEHVKYEAIKEKMLALPAGTLYLGADARDRDILVNLDTETPHIGLSMGTGRGKSVLLRLLLSQLAAQGADITILDVGMISLHEFRALPGTTVEYDVAKCWDLVTLFETEMMERLEQLVVLDEEEWPAVIATWRRRALVIEELNAFHSQSQAYWDSIRTSGQRATPPVLGQLTNISVMARKVLMHLAVSSQRFEAKLISTAARGQMGLRVMANPSAADWRMLGEGPKPRAGYSRKPGRVVAVVAHEASSVQVGYLERAEAKAHVITHRSVLQDVAPSYLATPQGKGGSVSYDTATFVTLRDYAKEYGESLDALRRSVQRVGLAARGEGEHGAKLYEPDDLRQLRATPSYDPTDVIPDVD